MSLPVQVISHMIMTSIGPILVSLASWYSKKEPVEPELDITQMDRLIKWMGMVFDGTEESITKKAHKQELYSIFVGIVSDYKQYIRTIQYNTSLWVFSVYRKKPTKDLVTKIMGDCALFKEGLQMFAMMN